MFRIASFLVTAFASLVFATLAAAQPTVTPTPVNAPVSVTNIGTNHWKIDLEAHPTEEETFFEIVRATASDIIEITVIPADDFDRVVYLEIGTNTNRFAEVESIALDTSGIGDPGPLFVDTIYAGTLGEVSANFIATARITDDIVGPITLTSTESLGPAHIGSLKSDSGDLLGDITITGTIVDSVVVPGQLTELDIQSGVIGSLSEPVTIAVDGEIRQIKAGEINAFIRGSDHSGADETITQIRRIDTFTNGGATSGKFRGEIRAETFKVGGGIWGMTLAGAFEGTALLNVLNQSSESTSINVPAGCMKGQIIVQNTGSDVWNAGVFVGTGGGQIELRGTDYSPEGVYPDSAASIGGGSIGQFPFYLHATDCIPAQGEEVDPNDEDRANNKVCMRHYGPVAWDSGDGHPYKVERRKAGSSDSWVEQSCFTCEMDENNDTIVWVKTTSVDRFQRGFEYRVSRRVRSGDSSNVLRCKLPHLSLSTYPEVADFDPLVFQVCDAYFASSPGDADDNGIVDNEDIDSVLEHWGTTACMKYGDADRNGVVNSVDLDIAELYVSQEYCYEAPQGFMKIADGFAQMDLDSDPAAMSSLMTMSEALAAMGYTNSAHFGEAYDAMEAPARAAARSVLMALISGE